MTQTYVFDPPGQASLAVFDCAERFPLRRIYCVGRNYAAHAWEMGSNPDREPPFFFSKPADAAFDAGEMDNASIPYPPATSDLHHEIELVVAIGQAGNCITSEKALSHVFGYAVGIDLTRRDLQSIAKKTNRPWDLSKGFDLSAPIGPIVRQTAGFDPTSGSIELTIDRQARQKADLADQIWPVADIIASLSTSIELRPGDLIMTGTPAGVGPVAPGQTLHGKIEGLPGIVVTIT